MTPEPPAVEVEELIAGLAGLDSFGSSPHGPYSGETIVVLPTSVRDRAAEALARLSSEKAALEGERDEALRQSLTFKKYWHDEREVCRKARNEVDGLHHRLTAAETSARVAREALAGIVTCGCADEQLAAARAALEGMQAEGMSSGSEG